MKMVKLLVTIQILSGFELNIKKIKFNHQEKIFIIGAGGVVPSLIMALKKDESDKYNY